MGANNNDILFFIGTTRITSDRRTIGGITFFGRGEGQADASDNESAEYESFSGADGDAEERMLTEDFIV